MTNQGIRVISGDLWGSIMVTNGDSWGVMWYNGNMDEDIVSPTFFHTIFRNNGSVEDLHIWDHDTGRACLT